MLTCATLSNTGKLKLNCVIRKCDSMICLVSPIWDFYQYYFDCPINIYLFKVSNRNTRKRSKICSKLKKYQNNIDIGLVSLLLTLNILHIFFSVSVADFEQVSFSWVNSRHINGSLSVIVIYHFDFSCNIPRIQYYIERYRVRTSYLCWNIFQGFRCYKTE